MDKSLLPFFQPKSVVVVGASTNPIKPGYGAARSLVESGYRGAIHFVSRNKGELLGRPVYADLAEVPGPIDLAVIIVPAEGVPQALEDCGERGIRAAIVLSGGFREVGPEGAALEDELVRIAKAHDMRIIGPNCVGLLDIHMPFNASFLPPPLPLAGEVAIVSQSGAMLSIIIDWARTEEIGFSRLMSLGNKADVKETDVLEEAAAQEQTRLLAMYIEALTDGPQFIQEARKVARSKPIVALKVGRSEAGQQAAASHTGALAGSDTAYQAAFERAGILRAATSEEFFDWMIAFTRCPLPAGRRVAVLTNAGGPGVIASDAVEAYQMRLAELSEATVKTLRTFLPPAASLHNPVDMLASASPEDFGRALGLLLAEASVDAAVVLLPAPPMFPAEEVARAIIPVIRASAKPVVVTLLGQMRVNAAHDLLRKSGVASYPSTERAVAALAGLAKRAEFEQQPEAQTPARENVNRQAAEEALRSAKPGEWLDQEATARLLAAYGIRSAAGRLARSPEEAEALSARLGFPVAVKVASPDIPHKSDIGGILLDIPTAEEAAAAFRKVTERARAAEPAAQIEGALLQRMIPPGQEVIAGAVRDEVFGALMMFGSGGVEVEGLKDVAFDLAPLTEAEAERMLNRTWAGRKLGGFRSIPPADAGAVREVLMRLAQLAEDFPQIREVEINPLRVLAPGRGAVALDARVKIAPNPQTG
jgi:acetyl coenzyme A synthetase (ADP forming)-like protein